MNSPRVLIVSGVVVGLLAGVALGRWAYVADEGVPAASTPITAPPPSAAANGAASMLSKQLSTDEARRLAEVLSQVRREYVDEVPDDKLVDSAVRGMLSGLDAHSAYLDQREFEEIRRGAAGHYPGIGIEVSAENGFIKVQRPLEESPAARAGIRAGDLILRIDGEPVGLNVAEAIEQMRGPAGSMVRLTVRRAARDELVDVVLERHASKCTACRALASIRGTAIFALLLSATRHRPTSPKRYSACGANSRN